MNININVTEHDLIKHELILNKVLMDKGNIRTNAALIQKTKQKQQNSFQYRNIRNQYYEKIRLRNTKTVTFYKTKIDH